MASRGKIKARKRAAAAMRLAQFERRRQRVEQNLPLTPDLLYAGPAGMVRRSMEMMDFNPRKLERDLSKL